MTNTDENPAGNTPQQPRRFMSERSRVERAFLERIGCTIPVLQAPMAGATTPRLAATVSAAGGLGGVGLGAASVADARQQLRDARALGARRINANFFLHTTPQRDVEREAASLAGASTVSRLLGVDDDREASTLFEPFVPFGSEMLEMLTEERPSVVTFHFAVPDAEIVSTLHDLEIVIGVSATTCDEARAVAAGGCDFVIAQGAEAGGHRGQFDSAEDRGMIGTLALVPQVSDAVAIPVVAAGGIADGRGLVAARALGAAAVQVGTAFLHCEEAATSPRHRRALSSVSAGDMVVTRSFSGRPARAIRNAAMVELEAASEPAEFPLQFVATAPIRSAGLISQDTEAMWAGQAAPLARSESATSVVRRFASEAASVVRHRIDG